MEKSYHNNVLEFLNYLLNWTFENGYNSIKLENKPTTYEVFDFSKHTFLEHNQYQMDFTKEFQTIKKTVIHPFVEIEQQFQFDVSDANEAKEGIKIILFLELWLKEMSPSLFLLHLYRIQDILNMLHQKNSFEPNFPFLLLDYSIDKVLHYLNLILRNHIYYHINQILLLSTEEERSQYFEENWNVELHLNIQEILAIDIIKDEYKQENFFGNFDFDKEMLDCLEQTQYHREEQKVKEIRTLLCNESIESLQKIRNYSRILKSKQRLFCKTHFEYYEKILTTLINYLKRKNGSKTKDINMDPRMRLLLK